MKLAKFWNELTNNAIECKLCPHNCHINEGKAGICRIRENRGGILYAVNYGLVSSIALDPIEKKPLRHFYPGSQILSIGGFGCNFHCPFCQNSAISLEYDKIASQLSLNDSCNNVMAPAEVLTYAKKMIPNGNIGVAYTYNEPLIGYEFIYDCAELIHEAGLKNVVVSNGFISEDALEELLPLIDAMNIDLKAFTTAFYRKIGGDLEAVKRTISKAREKCHVEVTTLVIPNENENDIKEIAKWLASLSPDIPLHLTRFYPRYKYNEKSPTNAMTIARLAENASKYLKNVMI